MKHIDKSRLVNPDLDQWHAYQIEHGTLQQEYNDTRVSGDKLWKFLDNHREKSAADSYSKKELKNLLVEQQHHLCCYCGKRIEKDHHTPIEHIFPKSELAYKPRTYDYTNLLASCHGGQKYKPYTLKATDIGEDNDRTLNKLSSSFGLDREAILTIYVEVHTNEHIKELKKLYDIENLQAGDKVFLAYKAPKGQKHCDHAKGNKIIPLNPTMVDIESYFQYLPDGSIRTDYTDINKQNNITDTVGKLGLNDSILLKTERKVVIEKAHILKRKLFSISANPTIFRQRIAQYINKYSTPDSDGKLPPFAFVTVSILTNN